MKPWLGYVQWHSLEIRNECKSAKVASSEDSWDSKSDNGRVHLILGRGYRRHPSQVHRGGPHVPDQPDRRYPLRETNILQVSLCEGDPPWPNKPPYAPVQMSDFRFTSNRPSQGNNWSNHVNPPLAWSGPAKPLTYS